MEELAKELVKQIPSLCVLAWVVFKFLTHLKDVDAQSAEAIRENTKAVTALRETLLDKAA